MPKLTVLPQDQYKRSTWKNGLGHTDEIAIHPPTADLRRGDFLFRLSSARIAQASPFSVFAEHDRTIVILDGDGMRLTHTIEGDEDSVELPAFQPYDFPGDVPSRCDLLGGPVQDLSLFVRKGAAEAVTEVLELVEEEPAPWFPAGRWNFLFAAEAPLEVSWLGRTHALARGDSLRVDLDGPPTTEAESEPLLVSGSGRAVVVSVQG